MLILGETAHILQSLEGPQKHEVDRILWRSGSRKSNIEQFLVLGSATFSHLMIIPEHPSISGGGIIIKHCTQGCHFLKTEFRASQKLLNINTANAVRQ